MKNKAKFTEESEARKAYKQWCKERVKRGLKCNNECTFCLDYWLDMEEDNYGTDCTNDDYENDEWYWRVEFPLGLEDGDKENENGKEF